MPRSVRSPQATVTSPKAPAVPRHGNIVKQHKSAGLSINNQHGGEESQLEDEIVNVEASLVAQSKGFDNFQKCSQARATTITKESWTQTDIPPLRDQFTQVEEEEEQSRVARWLACRVVEESLREVVEEEEERSVRKREEEEGRGLSIKKLLGKKETIGARKVKWAGNMW